MSNNNMGGLGVSLKDLSSQKEKIEENREINLIDNKLDKPFDMEQLIRAWIDYTNTIEWDHHFKNSLLNCKPQNLQNSMFEIVVNNQMQEDKLKEESIKILNYLRSKLRNSSILMNIRIDVENEKRLAFTPMEKYKLMIEENENLRLLKDELNLEIL